VFVKLRKPCVSTIHSFRNVLSYTARIQFPKACGYGPERGFRSIGNDPDDPINRRHAIGALEITTTTNHIPHATNQPSTIVWVSCYTSVYGSNISLLSRKASVIEAGNCPTPPAGTLPLFVLMAPFSESRDSWRWRN
jgi:hypothetical protein